MLAEYQQGDCGLFEWLGKPESPEKKHYKIVWNRQNGLDIGLPDGMGVPNRQATQVDGSTEITFWVNGAQWLSGRVLDSRPRGRGCEPHRRHCVVVLEQDTFILA